jgi:ubiquinone/menaquinone biosynthesis C-methylase UbiE
MGWWLEQVVPRVAHACLDVAEVRELRPPVCEGLAGDVAEIGFGSGLNVPHYPAEVAGVWAIEPSDVAWRMARSRLAGSRIPVHRAGLDGQAMDLPDDRFDAVLSTFTLCTIPDVDVALAEVSRVLRPGGTFRFLEHGRSPEPRVARWQDRMQPVYGPVAGGCHLNRPIADIVDRSSLTVERVDRFHAGGAKPFAYVFRGHARKAA